MEFCFPWGFWEPILHRYRRQIYIFAHIHILRHIDYSNENPGIVCLGNRTQIRDQELGSRWFSRVGCKSHLFTDQRKYVAMLWDRGEDILWAWIRRDKVRHSYMGKERQCGLSDNAIQRKPLAVVFSEKCFWRSKLECIISFLDSDQSFHCLITQQNLPTSGYLPSWWAQEVPSSLTSKHLYQLYLNYKNKI